MHTTGTGVAVAGGADEGAARRAWLVGLAVVLAYVVSARLGLLLALPPGKATAVFPASGVALAAVLLRGRGVWPAIALGAFVANLSLRHGGGTPDGLPADVAISALIAAGATLEALVASWLLRWRGAEHGTFDGTSQVLVLTLLAAPAGAAVSAGVGVTTLAAAGVFPWSAAPLNALTWWLGDLAGVLVFTPLIVSHLGGAPEAWPSPVGVAEGVAHGFGVIAATSVVFLIGNPQHLPIAFGALPVLVVVAVRAGLRGTTRALLAVSLVALWGTMLGRGPLGRPDLGLYPALLLLQAFVGGAALSVLVLAANLRSRHFALAQLEQVRGELERRVGERTAEVRAAYDRLLREQQKLALHVQQTPLGVIEWDPDFRATDWNPAAERIFGFKAEQAIGRRASELIVPEEVRHHVDRIFAELIAHRGGTRSTNRNVTRDGRTIECEWYNTPLVDGSGRVVGVASLVQDVTERLAAEAERDRLLVAYREALASRDEFLSVASHELRTPLTSVQLAVQGLQRRVRLGDVVEERTLGALALVGRQTTRLATLVDELLDLSRLQEGRLRLDVAEHDVAALVREAVTTLQGDLAASGSVAHLELDQPVVARVDATRVGQIATNLFANAIKYGGGRDIAVRVRDDGDDVVLEVADAGIGIAEADQQRVFDRYARAVSARHYSGFGLGLHIVRVLTEAHGGRVELRSTPGEGSTFTVRLPRAGPPAVGVAEPVPVASTPG